MATARWMMISIFGGEGMKKSTLEICKDLILLAEFYCQQHGGAYHANFRDELRASVACAIEALTKCDNSVNESVEKPL